MELNQLVGGCCDTHIAFWDIGEGDLVPLRVGGEPASHSPLGEGMAGALHTPHTSKVQMRETILRNKQNIKYVGSSLKLST